MMKMKDERRSESYYSILGVNVDSSVEEIRRAYRKLARQWHPDKWTKSPSLLGEAKLKFQHIQEAYSVLSDQGKRALYDAGLYDPEDEQEEEFSDFVQEMLSLMHQAKKEDKIYSMDELQSMFMEMAQDFEPSFSGFHESPILGKSDAASHTMTNTGFNLDLPGWQMYGTSGFCR